MKFPKSEAEVCALARAIMVGLSQLGPGDPVPPVSLEQLKAMDRGFEDCRQATVLKDAEAGIQRAEKRKLFGRYKGLMKTTLRWAEAVFRDRPNQLTAFGWGKPRTRRPLVAPGQVLNNVVLAQGTNWVILDWKKPADGGAVAAYKIQRRKNRGDWEDVAMAVESEQHLKNQPKGVELEYQVIAFNRAGEGMPSGVVTLVL